MKLEDIFAQLKNIQPDAGYTEVSRRALLAMEPVITRPISARRTLLRILETSVAVALAGFFVILITGGLSGSRFAPQYSAIDPQSLHAEAEAIDIQIQIANLKYSEVSSAESTLASPVLKPKAGSSKVGAPSVAQSTSPTANGSTTSATSTSVSIDQALQGLSE